MCISTLLHHRDFGTYLRLRYSCSNNTSKKYSNSFRNLTLSHMLYWNSTNRHLGRGGEPCSSEPQQYPT